MPSNDIQHVEPRDTSKPNSLIVASEESVFSSEGAVCYWNGQAYPPGAKVCSEDLPARRTQRTGLGSLWVTANEPSPPERSQSEPNYWFDMEEHARS